MAKGNTWINDSLKLLFNATAIANIADNAASSPLTNLYAALHTADPGAAGSQNTTEAGYSGYARVAIARTSGGFTISGQSVTLAANVTFAQAPVSATDVLKFWSIGTASSGAGKILYSGVIGSNLGAGTAVAATDTITIPGLTGVAVADQIAFLAPTGGTIPTGVTAGTVYYVKTLSGNDITISTTSGGSTLDITAAGQVLAYKVTPITTGGGLLVTPQLTTGLTITEL
jgi:hypothetical protein